MGEVIDFKASPKNRTINVAWARYVEAKARVEETQDIRDGIAAGKAWARFLSLFLPEEHKNECS
jgi:hypothetical protein